MFIVQNFTQTNGIVLANTFYYAYVYLVEYASLLSLSSLSLLSLLSLFLFIYYFNPAHGQPWDT